MNAGWIELGRFGRPHGVRGEVRFWPHNAESELLRAGRVIRVGRTAEAASEYRIEALRRDSHGVVLQLQGVADRDAAGSLNGLLWFEDRAAFPALEGDELYSADLVGLTVRTEEGERVGEVVAVWQQGGADQLVVREGRHEHYIPLVDEFVVAVRLAEGEVIVRLIPGLLELARE